MLRRLTHTVLAAGLTTLLATAAQAQATCGASGATPSCTPTGTQVTGTLQRIVFLSVTNPSFGLTMPTDVDFLAAGSVAKADLGAQVVTVRANATWTLTLQGAAWTGTGNNGKSVGDLEWTKNGGTNWTTMTTSAATLATGAPTAGSGTTVGYRTTWTLTTDTPGTYTMGLTFTLSSP